MQVVIYLKCELLYFLYMSRDRRPARRTSKRIPSAMLFISEFVHRRVNLARFLRRQRGNEATRNEKTHKHKYVRKEKCGREAVHEKREKGKEVHGEGKENTTRDTTENRRRKHHSSAHPVAPSFGT